MFYLYIGKFKGWQRIYESTGVATCLPAGDRLLVSLLYCRKSTRIYYNKNKYDMATRENGKVEIRKDHFNLNKINCFQNSQQNFLGNLQPE